MSEYTFRLVATDNFDQEIVRINQFVARMREAMAGTGAGGPTAAQGEQFARGFEQIGARMREQAAQVGNDVKRQLEAGLVPDASLNRRLTQVYSGALSEIETLVREFAGSTGLQLGSELAVGLQRSVGGIRAALLGEIESIATQGRAALASIAAPVGGARQVFGNRGFTGAAASSETNIREILGTGAIEDTRTETAAAGRRLAGRAATTSKTLIEQVVEGLLQGILPTQGQLARLRAQGLTTDVGRGVSSPIGVAGHYLQLKGENVIGGEEIPPVQLQRGEEQLTEARKREAAATQLAIENESRLATLRRLQSTPGTERLGTSLNAPYRDAAGKFYSATGQMYTDQAQVAQLNKQYASLLASRNRAQGAQNSALAVQNRSMGQAFVGGLFGHGFNPSGDAPVSAKQGLANLAGTAGVLLRYGATGVGINAAFTGLAEIKTQYLDLATAMAHLTEIEQGLGVEQINVNQAIQAGIPAGEGAAAAVITATEAMARYGEEIRNGADANTIATSTVRNVGQAMVLTGLDAKTAGERLIDATQGFHIGYAGQQRVLDAIENARKNFGGDRTEIITAMADAADLAANAGVDPEQLANIFALIQARTGASASAVSSAFERTISRAGTGQFQQALESLGVTNTGDIVDEIVQISQRYHELTRVQQSYLISQLGGARQARELLPLLQEGDQLLEANERSYNGAGAAAEQYARLQATLAGQLRQIAGGLRDVALQLASSGLVDIFGVFIYVLRPFVDGLDEALRFLNRLPHPARTAAAAIIELAVAVRLFGAASTQAAFGAVFGRIPVIGRAVTGILGTGGRAGGGAAAGATLEAGAETAAGTIITAGEVLAEEVTAAGGGVATALVESGTAAATAITDAAATLPAAGEVLAGEVTAAGAEVAGLLVEGGAAAAAEMSAGGAVAAGEQGFGAALGAARWNIPLEGKGLNAIVGGSTMFTRLGAMLFNPVTAAIAGLVAVGGVTEAFHRLDAAAAQGEQALHTLSTATTVDEFRTAQSQASAAAASERQGAGDTGGFFNQLFGHTAFAADWVLSGGHSSIIDRYSKDLKSEQYAKDEQARLEAEQAGSAMADAARLFGTSGQDVAAGLQAMDQQGYGAEQQIRAVAASLGVLNVSAGSVVGKMTGAANLPARGLLGNEPALAAITGAAISQGPDLKHLSRWQRTVPFGLFGGDKPHGSEAPDSAEAHAKVQEILDREGIGKREIIPADVQEEITDAVLNMYDFKGSEEQVDTYRKNTRRRILSAIKGLDAEAARKGRGPINNQELRTILEGNEQQPGFLQTLQNYQPSPTDPSGGIGTIRLALNNLRELANRSTKGHEKTKLMGEIEVWEARYVDAKISNLERLRHALQSRATSPAEVARIGQQFFEHEVNVALRNNNVNALIDILNMSDRAQIEIVRQSLQNTRDEARHAYMLARRQDALIDAMFPGGLGNPRSPDLGPGSPNPGLDKKKKAMDDADRAYRRFMRAMGVSDAPATGGDFSTGGGKLEELQQTHLAYIESLAVPGDELQNAQIAVQAAQYSVSIAEANSAEYWNAIKQLHDAQYQLAMAELTYANNIALLKIDITDPVARARQTVQAAARQTRFDRNRGASRGVIAADQVAENQARSDLKNTKFDQWLGDLRTAHDLGDIGDTAYINYLETRLRGLRGIHHKTRADIDHINQIRQELKSALEENAGQFNLGSIDVPTPYEVRRSLKSGANASSTTVIESHATTIHVNGTDIAMVQKVIKQALGPAAYRRATTSYRKS